MRLVGYIGIGILAGLLVAMLAILLLTRTQWGMERARSYVVGWLEDRVEGELRLGRITGPGLLGGVVIHDFGIVDERGRPFVIADSAELVYSWRTLLAGRIVLDRVSLYQPRVYFEKLPGDTIWNFEHIFPPAVPETPAERRLIMFDDARIINGRAVIRMPFEPDQPVAAADTARIILEPVPGGLARTMIFEDVNARLTRVIWESPIEHGRLFDIQTVQGRGYVWREPFMIRNGRGTVTTRDSIIAFDLPEVALPSSNAGILGRVVARTGTNDLDIRVDGQRVSFTDLQWLHPNLPDEGGGSLVLHIQTQPNGTLWLAEDARLSTRGTTIAGTVGIVTGDTVYFTRVDLRASPLDLDLIERLLPGTLPVEGLLVGTVEVRGPLSALETSGDLRLAGGGVGSGSHVVWRGVLDLRNQQIAARSMRADVRDLELALLTAFQPELRLGGTLTGELHGAGRLDRLTFTGALQHASPDGARSSVDGGGTVTGMGAGRRFDVSLQAAPVTLQDLAFHVPALRGMEGDLRGPVRLSGTAADLDFEAELATPAGTLELRGNVLGDGPTRRVTAVARAHGFALHALRPELPRTLATGTLELDVTGTDLATAAGSVRLVLDSARVGDLPLGRLTTGGTLADGLLSLDSASLLTAAGIGRAHGTVGLVHGREGRLQAAFMSESLTPLEVHLLGAAARGSDTDPRLAGRLDAVAAATGWIGDLTVEGRVLGERMVVGGTTAARLSADLHGTGIGGAAARFRISATADSLSVLSHAFASARLEIGRTADSTAISATGEADGVEKLYAAGVHFAAADAAVLRLDALRIGRGTSWALQAPATVRLHGGAADVGRIELRGAGGGRAVASGLLGWVEPGGAGDLPLDFELRLTAVPFTDVLRALRSGETGAGVLDGTLRVGGSAGDPLIEGELTGQELLYGDVRMDRTFAEVSYAGLGLDAHAEAQHDGRSIITGGGRIPLDLRFAPVSGRRLDEPLRFTIAADSLPPALPLGLLDGFSNVRGRIDGVVALAGTTLDPALTGGFALRNGTADWDATGVRYREVDGSFVLAGDRSVQVDVIGRATDPRARPARHRGAANAARGNGPGSGTVTGTLDFTELGDPRFDLHFSADRAYAAKRRDVDATVSGEVRLEGRYRRPEISGSLRVEQGTLFIDELYRQYLIVGIELDDPSLLSLVDTSLVAVRPLLATSTSPFLRNLFVRNMQVAVGNESWLRSADMDVEVSGNLNVAFDRRHEDLRLSGSLNVERGTYTLYYPPLQSRRFQVRHGTVDFPGTPGLDPNLAITAAYRARARGEPLDVLAVVSGTLQSPRVRLTSDSQPPISESDLASYLFFGVPTWEVAGAGGSGAADMRAMAGLGARAIGPSVLGYASSGLQALVQNAGLLDHVSLTAADLSPARRSTSGLTSFLAGTQLELGRYFSSEVFVGYTQRLGSASYDPAMRIEWRFLPEYSFELFGEDRFARAPAFGLRSETGLKKVYGFSLFREWGF
jgi:autotransporter translocation and assembly factor TamB